MSGGGIRGRLTARIRTALLLTTACAAALLTPVPAGALTPGPTLVRTHSGLLKGETTDEGRQFLGIPYAEQPVGALRWTAPRPAAPWRGVRDATRFADRCVQGASWDPGYERATLTEDCLALNVYVPGHRRGALPVLVWLHGGGLTAGAGSDVVPDAFARSTGSVVVTVNYRLGSLGFLALPGLDAEARDGVSGNYGMLDQQAALRWVRSEIGAFGGDPGRVTVAGESAGGRSVCTQLASPTARGLFRAAVIQSGAYGDCAARTRSRAAADGAAFARRAGCGERATALACLRRKPAAELLAAQSGLGWGPVTGGAFLPEQPATAFATGRSARVPVLNGANEDEGRLFAFSRYPLAAADYPGAVAGYFGAARAPEVLAHYPLSGFPSATLAYATAIGDQLMACPALRLDRALAARGPVYAYEFADRTSPPFASLRALHTDFDFGATHVNEVQYLFRHFGLDAPFDAEQRALARQMTAYWGSFLHGNPPRAAGQPAMPDWSGDDSPGRVLRLRTASADGNAVVTTVARAHRCGFWDAADAA
ncbi:carboxylesterase family protein [Streptomyces sp. BPTC-684]|uniref:carboxylesterase/lipase family protein n=1 Tax=Streptomyces sp. BPTC-684 TaxID=3043734 RepID=UPI0024B179B3|nr:carboxylesterase family protein [Streptomyces sp. BPTC-684]WHM39841.1 carboxylesterase family protein [Streptomyces sp. BPTC-684]